MDAFYPTADPQAFFRSLRRLAGMEKEVSRLLPGHYGEPERGLLRRAADAFARLDERGLLRQGSGIFGFGDFSVRL